MRQSNSYILIFTVGLTILVGGILAGASKLLAPAQQKSIERETKSQILSAVKNLVPIQKGDDLLGIYKKRISSMVVNYQGDEVTKDEKGDLVAEKVDILKNFKKDAKERLYPVFRLLSEGDSSKIEAYIIPVYGNGLWDKIWGYVALDATGKTIIGTSFDHKAETPGLGQRIATQEIQDRFVGKKIFNEEGKMVSVEMMKGEHGGGQSSIDYYKGEDHLVDGMSGATLTGKGLNEMLKNYFKGYRKFLEKVSSGKEMAKAESF